MNTVNQPTATLLKEAGWRNKTDFAYNSLGHLLYVKHCDELFKSDISAPSIAELRERLTREDFLNYWRTNMSEQMWTDWLYAVTADPNAMAQIWLWKKRISSNG